MSKISNIGVPANRFKAMLHMIPRAPDSISTERLQQRLSAEGFEVDVRTVQRNLKSLRESNEFGLELAKELKLEIKETEQEWARKGRKQNYWCYRKDAPVTIFPSLDDHTALAFRLADAFLQSLMPPETVQALRPFVDEAGKHLAKRRQVAAGKWQDKIHVFPQGMRRRAPSIRPEVREAVYRALLEEKPLRLMHLSRGKRESSEFVISPLGLVIRDYLIYLYGLTREKKQVLSFALNRTQSAEILEDAAFERPGAYFRLADHEHLVSMPLKGSAMLILKLRLSQYSAYSLRECPLLSRQSLNPDPENPEGQILTVEVPNTVELRQWIRSLGQNAEVLEPTFLRHEMTEEIAILAQRYGCLPTLAA